MEIDTKGKDTIQVAQDIFQQAGINAEMGGGQGGKINDGGIPIPNMTPYQAIEYCMNNTGPGGGS
jgi:hypothetical protein